MRGEDRGSQGFFSYVRLEECIAADHPLRAIRDLIDEALRKLSPSFSRLYAREGRPSIPPERLLRGLLLQAFYTVRSEWQLMEQLDYNLLFRWLVGLSVDDPVWDATVFCKNRDRLLNGDIARKFMTTVLNLPQVRSLLSSEHFSVDGTLIEAWASMKSFVPKDGSRPPSSGNGSGGGGGRNAARDFHGEKRANATHFSMTDPDARLFRKSAGKEAKLAHMGHLMMENRNGLIVDARLTEANGTAERTTALDMIDDNAKPGSTVGGDKNYDTADFVAGCRERRCTPHVAQNDTNRCSAIDGRTTRHPGYAVSMTKRKRIEEPFGWMKTVRGLRKTRHCGRPKTKWAKACSGASDSALAKAASAIANAAALWRAIPATLKHWWAPHTSTLALCRELDLLSVASVAIDGSKFKAVNARDKNFTEAKMKRRLERLDESIARYMAQLETADRRGDAVPEARILRFKDKIAKLRDEIARLSAINAEMMKSEDKQISLTDPDARA